MVKNGSDMYAVAMHVDVIIIGQGIAGTLLADRLCQMGKSVAIVDQGLHASATAIAAGLMEPMSGRKLAKAWEAQTVLPEAIGYYQSLEKRLGISLIQSLPVSRYFSDEQARLWQTKQKQFAAFPWEPVPVSDRAPYGGVTMMGAVVKTTRLLAAMRSRFRRHGMLHVHAVLDPEHLLETGNAYGVSGSYVVCTAGVGIAEMACWAHLRLQYSSGDVLCLRHSSVPKTRPTSALTMLPKGADVQCLGQRGVAGACCNRAVLHDRKLWIVPYSFSQIRIGATYRPFDPTLAVSVAGAKSLQAYAEDCLGTSLADLSQFVYAGGRCLGIDGRFWMGEHPTVSGLWAITGLGSKGVMFAPHLTAALAARLGC